MKFNNKNISIGKNVKLGKNVRIGDNTIIYDNVTIGDNSIICNDCIIGEPSYSYYLHEDYINPDTIIGKNALIRSHCIIYSDSQFGDNLNTGHRVTIREKTIAGQNCQFGSYSDIQGLCKIGNYVKCQSYVNIGQHSILGNYVFLYPFVVLTNDPTPPSNDIFGVELGDYSIISTASIILPRTCIGKHSMISANSTVSGTFNDDTFISGSPAKAIGKLSKMPFFNKTKLRHYPWPNNFNRGMPWSELGFEEWSKQIDNN